MFSKLVLSKLKKKSHFTENIGFFFREYLSLMLHNYKTYLLIIIKLL